MEIVRAKASLGGSVIGQLAFFQKDSPLPVRIAVEDVEAEIVRYHEAAAAAALRIEERGADALEHLGSAAAAIFQAQRLLAEDPDFSAAVETQIREQAVNVAYAVSQTGRRMADLFARMDDAYMRERASDLLDVTAEILSVLAEDGRTEHTRVMLRERDQKLPLILYAEDFLPSEVMRMAGKPIGALITKEGSTHSHASILAHAMGLVCLVGVELPMEAAGRTVVVDGQEGTLSIDPTEETIAECRQRMEEAANNARLLREMAEMETCTLDGHTVRLCANIGSITEVASVLEARADGIGLFRSEFLFLEADALPDEEEQYAIYRRVAAKMAPRRVVFRTIDLGGEKMPAYLEGTMPSEPNPALGCRGTRYALAHRDLLLTQLRALYRAARHGEIAIMFPMMISVNGVQRAMAAAEEARSSLLAEGEEVPSVPLGIMIETPAAALDSAAMAAEVDFFSIGTNDLTQYTLACDRNNPAMEAYYDTHHPAVWQLIELTVRAAVEAGIPVAVCGDLAADLSMTRQLLALGVTELSVAPAQLLRLREQIRKTELA